MSQESPAVSRRAFFKTAGALGALAAAGGYVAATGSVFGADTPQAHADTQETIVWNHCAINCPGRCAIKMHVQDDEIVRIETYSLDEHHQADVQPRACLRGRSYRAWLNDPDRINYPMKRADGSKRGDGKYEQTTWDDAISIIAKNYQDVLDNYGPEAVYVNYATGSSAVTARPWNRLCNTLGGCLSYYGSYSAAQVTWITPYIFGSTAGSGSTMYVARDAELILLFGTSPVETQQGGGISHYDYTAMREATQGKIYVIDPRFSDTVSGHSDQWIPINPGTDAALVAAIAHELIANGWVDTDFLHTYCVGYDEETLPDSAKGKNLSYYDYVMGAGYDKVEKTPEWAAPITGIAADAISSLAEEIGTVKPLFVEQGDGLQRRCRGEYNAWAVCMLPILTGQIGLPGTSNGLGVGSYAINLTNMPSGTNPVKAAISVFSMVDAVDRGSQMTEKADGVTGIAQLPYDIKFVINYAGNCITNQNADINWVHDVMSDESKCQFVLGSDILMTDSVKYADVILPDLFRLEQVSMIGTGGDNAYMVAGQPATSVKYDRKNAYDAATLIARAMGTEQAFTEGKSQEDWMKQCYDDSRSRDPQLPTYDEAMQTSVYTRKNPEGGTIAMEGFRNDPAANALKTPSGKIEIYSEQLAAYIAGHDFKDDDYVVAIPAYAPEWDGIGLPTDDYPLQLSGFHYRGRLHSSWGSIDILKELNPQELWINPADAEARNIRQGDSVQVKNDNGQIQLLAKVTPRVLPGVVVTAEGAWHDADMGGDRIDKGGCINTMTTHRPSALAKGNPQHTNICQVAKA